MPPSKIARRTGVVASGTFLLAMAASPAYAGLAGVTVPVPALGGPCTVATVLPTMLTCFHNIVTKVPVPVPVPAPKPTTVAVPTTVPTPISGLTSTVTGTVKGLTSAVQFLPPPSRCQAPSRPGPQ